jgi:hypothetical protein
MSCRNNIGQTTTEGHFSLSEQPQTSQTYLSEASFLAHGMAEVTVDGALLCQRFLVSTAVAYIRCRVPGKPQFSPTFTTNLHSPLLRSQPLVRSSFIIVSRRTGSTCVCASVIRNLSWDHTKFPLVLPSAVFLFQIPYPRCWCACRYDSERIPAYIMQLRRAPRLPTRSIVFSNSVHTCDGKLRRQQWASHVGSLQKATPWYKNLYFNTAQSCPRIHWFSIRGLPRPEKKIRKLKK